MLNLAGGKNYSKYYLSNKLYKKNLSIKLKILF